LRADSCLLPTIGEGFEAKLDIYIYIYIYIYINIKIKIKKKKKKKKKKKEHYLLNIPVATEVTLKVINHVNLNFINEFLKHRYI
jgi:hypothetical protein